MKILSFVISESQKLILFSSKVPFIFLFDFFFLIWQKWGIWGLNTKKKKHVKSNWTAQSHPSFMFLKRFTRPHIVYIKRWSPGREGRLWSVSDLLLVLMCSFPCHKAIFWANKEAPLPCCSAGLAIRNYSYNNSL